MMTLSGKEERSGIKPYYFTLLAKRKKGPLNQQQALACVYYKHHCIASATPLYIVIFMPFGSFPCVSTAR